MKVILYLRTDICDQELFSGGSVAHTLGVINGFMQLGYTIVCASSCMQQVLEKQNVEELITLKNPSILKCLRWKMNSFLSSIFFFKNLLFELKNKNIEFIYQRYSLLNFTGLLLAWWYKKKLILEYNGSEYWVAMHWVEKRRWIKFEWLMKCVEQQNITRADMIVVVSQVLQEELIGRGVQPNKILVNPNGVDTQKFRP